MPDADPAAETSSEGSSAITNAIIQDLPRYMEVVNRLSLPRAQAELGVAQAVSPDYQKLLNQLYAQYAPGLSATGSAIDAQNRLAQAEADRQLLTGGSALAIGKGARDLERVIDPEFYAVQDANIDKVGQLLGSIDLNSPNIEAERLINQENMRAGTDLVPSATNTVANALSFGNEQQKRRDALSRAVATASAVLGNTKTTFNPTQTLINRPATVGGAANALTQFGGVTNPSGAVDASGAELQQGLFGTKTAEMDINSQRRDSFDRLKSIFMPDSVSL